MKKEDLNKGDILYLVKDVYYIYLDITYGRGYKVLDFTFDYLDQVTGVKIVNDKGLISWYTVEKFSSLAEIRRKKLNSLKI